ncbi:transporter substrate-binding domain-containing protein [Curvibacter sp. APW13]|uniref:substrate-binding periplasmic protein n=1 Tax=Curvibacter sp. APW13 TaxID=3077236 RepID=UPI0028DD54A9|nr:transporter substrate-binding domain-containing protein [Curvibacter sp. APW13]MDT8992223.1 transporter substrate-binding domain-containing protein [Curvibacter sp. APW13]
MKKLLAFLIAGLVWLSPASAQQVLKVADPNGSTQYRNALTALYKEVGLVPEFVSLPGERALRSVENGEVDADLGRVTGATAGYQNTIELSEPIIEIGLVPVVKKDSPWGKLSLPDLKGKTVGAVRGTKMAEGAMAKLGQEPVLVNTSQQLFQMLAAGRIEVALTTSTSMPSAEELVGAKVLPPLFTSKAVHVLNKKWATLAPRIDVALKAMKADGRWAKLMAAP